ncbi:rab GTPase-binding effector protein 1-like [Elysia marginata]|uniref:Rab GTPase-binding effector protein 1-like n=1 Tax=Elysia marginata TaxID=1093978 RepID=A0AAV4H3G7_9GAST|nr:rab GTPase-binding effector protein 1-like [Elysia marginata]
MQLRLLKYCEEIISAKVAKEHAEDTVRAQVAFLKAQVTGDQKEPPWSRRCRNALSCCVESLIVLRDENCYVLWTPLIMYVRMPRRLDYEHCTQHVESSRSSTLTVSWKTRVTLILDLRIQLPLHRHCIA